MSRSPWVVFTVNGGKVNSVSGIKVNPPHPKTNSCICLGEFPLNALTVLINIGTRCHQRYPTTFHMKLIDTTGSLLH